MENIRLELSLNEVNAILGGLGKLPFEAVHQIIANIQLQTQQQLQQEQNLEISKEPS